MVLLPTGTGGKLSRVTRLTKDNVKAFTMPFQASRDITLSVELPAGQYVVIPMTYEPGGLGKFWLTVYAKAPGVRVLQCVEKDTNASISATAPLLDSLEVSR